MRFALPLVLLALAGCAADPAAPGAPTEFRDKADYRAQREATASTLAAAIEPATATQVAACRVVATSEQACGGPTSFAVYSAQSPEADEVERLAERLVALDRLANAQFEYVSTCMAYDPPVPVLRGGVCVAGGR